MTCETCNKELALVDIERTTGMTFCNAVSECAMYESIYRESDPDVLYAKNHPLPLSERVSVGMQNQNDWRIYSPHVMCRQDRTRRRINESYYVHHVCREEIDHLRTGRLLRSEREDCGMSLREMARQIGVSPTYLGHLETGKRKWTVAKIKCYTSKLDEYKAELKR